MKVRLLTDAGAEAFRAWLESRDIGEMPPSELLEGVDHTVTAVGVDVDIDLNRVFSTRYEFGQYITVLLGDDKVRQLLAQRHDGVWNWITVAYFSQFGRKMSKPWHYVLTRRGHAGSLAYRHLARTSVEMYWRHRHDSMVMLNVDMSTWGDMSEQLTSRQNIAHHQSCIKTANVLYLDAGKIRRGAASRVPAKAKRKPSDRRGRGAVGRLALAVRRLCRTYDTHVLKADQMIGLLPKEFSSFVAKSMPVAGSTA